MKIVKGLLDYNKPWTLPDIYLFTGNPIINSRGRIVMGRGAARQVRDTYPGVDKELAKAPGEYIKWVLLAPRMYLGWIKVKNHWSSVADLDLIEKSFKILNKLASYDKMKNVKFHCNYPGIGYGKLSYNSVNKRLVGLVDNIILYKE